MAKKTGPACADFCYKGTRIPRNRRNLPLIPISVVRLGLVLFCTWGVAISAMAQAVPFRFTEQPGPYAVGLKVVDQFDHSRTYRPLTDNLGRPYQGERARPLQTLIWYPATASSAKPMSVGDYVNLAATETSFGRPDPSNVESWRSALGASMASPLWAIRDAPWAQGHFPVVIYAPSFSSTSWENADLCELLASHGYVVVASPDMGPTAREMTNDVQGINAQAHDISFLIGYAATLPDTDISEIAVAGWSWGGISNLFAAARDNRIKALVALDGSMRYYPGLITKAGDVHPDQMTIPLLFFSQGEITLEQQARYLAEADNAGPSVLNAWKHGDLLMVDMLGLTHGEFSSMLQRKVLWKHFSEDQKADYGRDDGITGYAWVARYTLYFLDAYLKHDPLAAAFLKRPPVENGVPLHFMSAHFRSAKGPPASMDGFRAELGRQGFDHAASIYAAMKKDQPDFKLDEEAVDVWAHDLMAHGHLNEATELFKLNVQNYPISSSAYESLGEAYAKSKQKPLAIRSYEKSLELDPNNAEASEQLKKVR